MKKVIFCLILTIIFNSGISSAFVKNRHQWWNIRLKKLHDEKELLLNNTGINRRVVNLIDGEISRAEDILSIFQSSLEDSGDLSYERKTFSQEVIQKETDNILKPVFSLYYLDTLISEAYSGKNIEHAKETVKNYLNEILKKKLKTDCEDLAEMIIREDISSEDWQNISMELFIGRMIKSKKNINGITKKRILEKVMDKLADNNNITNQKELHSIITRASLDTLKDNIIINNLSNSRIALEESWAWKKSYNCIDKKIEAYKSIKSMLHGKQDTTYIMIRHYHKKPLDLDMILFSKGNDKYTYKKTSQKNRMDSKNTEDNYLEIPELPNSTQVYTAIDKLRKQTLLSLNGREEQDFFKNLGIRFEKIIYQYMNSTENEFFRGEEIIRMIKEKKQEKRSTRLKASDLDEFIKRKKAFTRMKKMVKSYTTKSVKFLKLLSEMKRTNGAAIINTLKYEVKRFTSYLFFLKNMVEDSSGISEISNTAIQKKYMTSYRKISLIYRFISTSTKLDRNDLQQLTKKENKTMRNLRSEFLNEMKIIRYDMKKFFVHYMNSRTEKIEKIKNREWGLKEKIAQYEVDIQYKNAAEYANLLQNFNYSEEAFTHYSLIFNKFKKDISSGNITGDLEYSIKMKSLFPVIKDFDKNRIITEYQTKKYLKRSAKTALSRLISLLRFYKQKNTKIAIKPELKDIKNIEKKISKKTEITLDKWRMNESNFSLIDNKLIQKLESIYTRVLWKKNMSNGDIKKSSTPSRSTVTIKEADITMTIPRGWEENTIGEMDKMKGTIRSYSSSDNNSSIHLIKIPLANSNIQSATLKWLLNRGISPVRKRWKKRQGIEYSWILSRDSKRYIMETYTILKNGYAIIINGRTTRNRYQLFKSKLKWVIDSIKI